jgi:hypothetical protein
MDLLVIICCCITISISVVLFITKWYNDAYNVPNVKPNLNKEFCRFIFAYDVPIDTKMRFQTYVMSICHSLTYDIQMQLLQNPPTYLIGKSARDFTQFAPLANTSTTEGKRQILDINAFASSPSLPGFASSDLVTCPHANEEVFFHEFCHEIHRLGLTSSQKIRMTSIFNTYNVKNSIYDINTYAFLNEEEFFAEMCQVYAGTTSRTDVTGGITQDMLKTSLSMMQEFLDSIWKTPYNLKPASCQFARCGFC